MVAQQPQSKHTHTLVILAFYNSKYNTHLFTLLLQYFTVINLVYSFYNKQYNPDQYIYIY